MDLDMATVTEVATFIRRASSGFASPGAGAAWESCAKALETYARGEVVLHAPAKRWHVIGQAFLCVGIDEEVLAPTAEAAWSTIERLFSTRQYGDGEVSEVVCNSIEEVLVAPAGGV